MSGPPPLIGGVHDVASNEFVDVASWSTPYELHIRAGGRLRFACNMAISLSCSRLFVHPGGKLEIGSTQVGSSIHITTNRIEVHGVSGSTPGGALIVGTETEPARGTVVFTLTGSNVTTAPEDRSFMVESGATLDLHGDPRSDTTCWTQLSADAIPGASSIELVLIANFQWQPGDKIVVASTDFLKVNSKTFGGPDVLGVDQTEEFTVLAVNGNVLDVDPPISHYHFGSVVAGGIDQRAEVGLLTRNVRIEGAPGTAGGFELGGQVRFMQAVGQTTTVHIEWTELTNLGRGPEAVKGWYPLHFHKMNSVAGSYVKNCSLHDNNRNGLVIHETDDLLADSNVFYNTNGWHVWFQDDDPNQGIRNFSKNNTLSNNLAILAKEDLTIEKNPFLDVLGHAACFYIRSFNNVFRGNHAASSQSSGFYVDTQEPWGTRGQWSITHDFKDDMFRDNVAHSNGDHGFYMGGATEFPMGPPTALSRIPKFLNFTAYKNNSFGFHCRNFGTCIWENPMLSDNGAGVYLASSGYWLRENQAVGEIRGGVIRGDSENFGEPYPAGYPRPGNRNRSVAVTRGHSLFNYIDNELTGVSMYDGLVSVLGTSFQGFANPPPAGYVVARPKAGAFSPAAYDNKWAVDSRNIAVGTTFDAATVAAQAELYFRPPPLQPIGGYPSGVNHTILNDKSGTVIGVPGVAYPTLNTNLAQYGNPINHAAHGAKQLATSAAPFDQPYAQVVLYHQDPTAQATLTYGSGSEISEGNFIGDVIRYWTPANIPVKDTNVSMLSWNVVTGTGGVQPHHVVQFTPLANRFNVLVMGGSPGRVVDLEIPFSRPGPLTATSANEYGPASGAVLVPEVFIQSAFDTSTVTCFYRPTGKVLLRVVVPLSTVNEWTLPVITATYGTHFTGGATYVDFQ